MIARGEISPATPDPSIQMKKCILTTTLFLTGLGSALAQDVPSGNPPSADRRPSPTAADQAWEALRVAKATAERLPEISSADAATRQRAREQRAARSTVIADQARNFYATNPAHALAPEARNMEIFSLIQTVEDGDETVLERLNQSVATLRTDASISVEMRVRGIAAHEFTQAVRQANGDSERKAAIERTARGIIAEFPTEPQGYEALLAVARAVSPTHSAEMAREIVTSQAPDQIKRSAQVLLDQYALVGRLWSETVGAELISVLPADQPVIIYSWATWGPGSLELGRMIQGRRLAAVGICLDEDVEAAKKTEHSEGLGGRHLYDPKGRAGVVVNQLKFSTAGEIYLVDVKGVIRDVRGGENLEEKLNAMGFTTPVLVRPSTSELLRQ